MAGPEDKFALDYRIWIESGFTYDFNLDVEDAGPANLAASIQQLLIVSTFYYDSNTNRLLVTPSTKQSVTPIFTGTEIRLGDVDLEVQGDTVVGYSLDGGKVIPFAQPFPLPDLFLKVFHRNT